VGLEVSVALAAGAVIAAAVGLVVCVVAAIRQHRSGSPAWAATSLWRGKARSFSAAAALVLLVATFTPWVFGSAVGVALPSTVWGLPWARWIFGLPALVAAAMVVLGPWESFGWLRVMTGVVLGGCAGLGGSAMILVAAASDASKSTFVADTLLRGLDHAHTLAPVVRTGVGAPIYTFASVIAVWTVALNARFGRREIVAEVDPIFDTPDAPFGKPSPDRFNPGDDWWQ
jgi:hypothetical protein